MGERISWQDATTMFNKTVVLYKGEPAYCMSISENMVALIRDLETAKLRRVTFDVDDFQNVNKRLGYVNMGTFAFYLERNPIRMYKVGLAKDNVQVKYGDFQYDEDEQRIIRNTSYGLTEPSLADTLKNVFPPFDEVWNAVKDQEARLLAFDRQFALGRKEGENQGRLFYKGRRVGVLDWKKGCDVNKTMMTKGYESLLSLIGTNFKLGSM